MFFMYEIDNQKFGGFIAALRKEKGYTQKELAEKADISDVHLSRIENGVVSLMNCWEKPFICQTIKNTYIPVFTKCGICLSWDSAY